MVKNSHTEMRSSRERFLEVTYVKMQVKMHYCICAGAGALLSELCNTYVSF